MIGREERRAYDTRAGVFHLAEINVERLGDQDGAMRFAVHIREGDSSTAHDVTVSTHDLDRLGARYASPEGFVEACFGFLLEREPKESILRSFDVAVIAGYFPEFDRVIARDG